MCIPFLNFLKLRTIIMINRSSLQQLCTWVVSKAFWSSCLLTQAAGNITASAASLRSVLQAGGIYFIVTEGLVGALHVRQRHPQGFHFSAAGQQLGVQLFPLTLDPLRLRLQTGQLHCARATHNEPLTFTVLLDGKPVGTKPLTGSPGRQ